jgi:hypothetical protein
MRSRFVASLITVTAVVAVFALAPIVTAGQGPSPESQASRAQAPGSKPYTPPRAPDGHPDLQGVWRVWNLAAHDIQDHSARWGVPAGRGVVEGNEIPYQPWAAAKKQENFDNSRTPDPLKSADPLSRCYLPGVPRITYLGFPFQIFQTSDYVAILYEWRHVRRTIYLRDMPLMQNVDFWMGNSRGRWEGNTLVVDVRNVSDRTWFDAAGNFHSEAMHVVERYTPIGPDTLQYEVMIEDPKVFTRPWKMSMPLQRQKDVGILEYECHALLEESGVPLTWDRLKYFK